ncbi:putative bifunctional diguanylate cyclase/phosphodiesterase [Plastoroseomonas hellenica]|uniref:putative bifunctional diguanylate cyclase/phosphodiesterase n=1 Tax=Plastoroseomonas hellenica TaxID=2687306 RepID=UPI001BAB941F|nr:EAL domain-containing protein [Plastoroseomonas hellenica]MBR0641438.1 EAL domain-containing protein [Plastoroseomonas hellenica]
MKCPPALPEESERLRALSEYGLSADRPMPSLDPVVRVAARAFNMPISAVNIVGSDHVFFAASTGAELGTLDMRRDVSFCAHAITEHGVMVVPDAALDERFQDNPLVTGAASLRFYAGVPLRSSCGHAIGALCVVDTKPRDDFTSEDQDRLRELARLASDRLEVQRLTILAQQNQPHIAGMPSHLPAPVICFDEVGTMLALNEAAAELHGYLPADMIGSPVAMLVAGPDQPALQGMLRALLLREKSPAVALERRELRGLRKGGEEFTLELTPFRWQEQGQQRYSATLRDTTERQEHARELRRLNSSDHLTGLANRASLQVSLEQMLAAARSAAVVVVGLDGFKALNSALGRAIGDEVLREVARRLRHAVSPADVLARIGGDEFGIVLPDAPSPEHARGVADTLTVRIADPFMVAGHEIRLASSSGIAMGPLHAEDALELIGNAELALAHAKGSGKRRSFVFLPTLRMEAVSQRQFAVDLHRAVENNELRLHFQPQFRLSDGALAGAEALIRWQHPQRGLLSPAAFLPALEAGPLAAIVGEWMLDTACAQARAWRELAVPDLRIAVNLFQAQFQVGSLAEAVIAALTRRSLPAACLELEITENTVLNQDEATLESLVELQRHGVGIAFDDFGTGHASLSLLKRYPLSRLKIDRSFVQTVMNAGPDANVVRAILDLARSFGLATTAEGIETVAQRDRLREEGCDEGQGYLFGRALPPAEFAEVFLSDRAPPLAALARDRAGSASP